MNEYSLMEIVIVTLLVASSLAYLAWRIGQALYALSKPHDKAAGCGTCGGCSAGKNTK